MMIELNNGPTEFVVESFPVFLFTDFLNIFSSTKKNLLFNEIFVCLLYNFCCSQNKQEIITIFIFYMFDCDS